MSAESKPDKSKSIAFKGLAPSQLSQGLSDLWGGISATTAPGAQTPTEVRICTLNLIVCIQDKSTLDSILEAARQASQVHPLRAVLLVPEPESDQDLAEGQVSGYCSITDTGDMQICCEQVILSAKGKTVDLLPASAANLLIPDVPVILWWLDRPPFGTKNFERLESISDYVIIDSFSFARKTDDFCLVKSAIERYRQVGVGDLNWARLASWRDQIAALFDYPEVLDYVNDIEEVKIQYASDDEPNPSEAILMAGWLGSKLRWTEAEIKIDSKGHWESVVHSPSGKDVTVQIIPESMEHLSPGNLTSIRICARSGEADFLVTRPGVKTLDVSAKVKGSTVVQTTHEVGTPSLGQLVSIEVESLGADTVYEESIASGVQLIRKEERKAA